MAPGEVVKCRGGRYASADDGQAGAGFADFEAALVREGLRLRHLAAHHRAA